MVWPTTSVQTDALDNSTDDLESGRVQLLDMANKVNGMIYSRGSNNGIAALDQQGNIDKSQDPRARTTNYSGTLTKDFHGEIFLVSGTHNITLVPSVLGTGFEITLLLRTPSAKAVISVKDSVGNYLQTITIEGAQCRTYRVVSGLLECVFSNKWTYGGYVNASSTTQTKLPPNWSIAYPSVGQQTITHNLSLASPQKSYLHPTLQKIGSVASVANVQLLVTAISASYFTVECYNTSTSSYVNCEYAFNVNSLGVEVPPAL